MDKMDDGDIVMDGDVSDAKGVADELDRGFNVDGEQDDGVSYDDMDDEDDIELKEFDPRDYPELLKRRGQLPTGCCYDVRMSFHSNIEFYASDHHPEDPQRIAAIFNGFKKAGLIFEGTEADMVKVLETNPTLYMWRIPAREASKQEICLVHSAKHYDWIQSLSTIEDADVIRQLSKEWEASDSVYFGSMTYEASLVSAGGAIETCKAVVEGRVKNAIAVIRPPGHHAEFDKPMGFCIFNNVPIAAKVCQQEYPEQCRKVLILDWDVHHGNGIQNMFYEDPNVLYISLHVFKADGVFFYPGMPKNEIGPSGSIDCCGAGPGLGKNVNIGWNSQGMGDQEYIAAFQKIVMPIAHEFNPDLVIISAGFDAAKGDQLGGCMVTPECYAHMTHMLMSLAGGKVAVCLEGGYNLASISASALAVARTLMGEAPAKLDLAKKIDAEAARVIARVQAHQAPYWECMRPGIVDVFDAQSNGAERLHDLIREAQRMRLFKDFGMLPLYLQHNVVYKSFENQVLVTSAIAKAKRILVIIHDPPELLAQPDVIARRVDAHNAWVSDGVQEYIKWGVKDGFGIIDINVPQYITRPEDTDQFITPYDESELQKQIFNITTYIWDNYLELFEDTEDIFIIGVGAAYLGIKQLLITRESKTRIAGVVSFVTGNLRPVKSDMDPDLSTWYRENSRVYVDNEHACWKSDDLTRKINKRRFGAVKRSPVTGLNIMMRHHAEDARAWINGRTTRHDKGDTTEEDDPAAKAV